MVLASFLPLTFGPYRDSPAGPKKTTKSKINNKKMFHRIKISPATSRFVLFTDRCLAAPTLSPPPYSLSLPTPSLSPSLAPLNCTQPLSPLSLRRVLFLHTEAAGLVLPLPFMHRFVVGGLLVEGGKASAVPLLF